MKANVDARVSFPPAAVAPGRTYVRQAAVAAATAHEVWVLLGRWRGDNLQMLALADAIGIPYRAFQLRFNALSALPNWLLGASRSSAECDAAIGPPWPIAVISSGRRAVPLARWIRGQAGAATRLFHIGRPWAPVSWFDLVVTTPQYRLPYRYNVLRNTMPLCTPGRFRQAEDPAGISAQLARLPRPHVAVFVGGPARPYVLDRTVAREIGARAVALAGHGTVIVVAGPRTPAAVVGTLKKELPASAVVCPWNAAANPYALVRADADRILVTIDSASMVAELITAGASVEVFPLPVCRDVRMVFNRWLETAAARRPAVARMRSALVAAGLLTSIRDLGEYVEALRNDGLFDDAKLAEARQAVELQAAARRARHLISAHS